MSSPRTFDQRGERSSLVAVVVLGSVFFTYAILRAARVALTIDEATTFLNYVRRGFFGLTTMDTANNHVLNTLLTWLVTRVAGTGVFALRLPNLAGYLLYLIFSYRLLKRYAPGLIAVSGFIVLNANPFVLEFFALCRGYGLSLGLLIAALYYFFRFQEELRENRPDALSSLSAALFAAGAAVLANMTLLIVFLSLVLLVAVIIADRNSRASLDRAEFSRKRRRRLHPLLAAGVGGLILLINGDNLFQGVTLSAGLYENVSVSIRGVTAEERAAILVVYDNIAGQPSLIPAAEDGWRTERPCFVARLRVGLPPALGTKITSLDIRIGPRSFAFGGTGLPGLETAAVQDKIALAIPENVSLPRSRFSAVGGCVNWKGDGAYLARLGERILIAGGGFLFLGLALLGIGRVAARLRLLTDEQFRPLAGAVWAVAAMTAVPVYLLERTEMLYWGGKVGFFHDTWINLFTDSFYGRSYSRGQEYIAFGILAVTIIGAILLNLIRRPDRRAPAGGPLLYLSGLVLVFSGFYLEQHVLLGTPYLLGRTAVFYAPLFGLLLILALASLRAYPRLKTAAAAACVAAALLAGVHFSLAANTSFAWEWKSDADYKLLLSDLREMRGTAAPADRPIRLAIRWPSEAPLRYYVERDRLDWLRLQDIPRNEATDLYFLSDAFDESRMVLVKNYPRSGHILVREKQPRRRNNFGDR